tara:strand:+ start:11514 stop:12098 length:585 start_codon:yes stop_codon:yes gene_type:complete
MNIFVQTETNDTIPIEVRADWTVGNLCEELRYIYTYPVLSYQGIQLRNLDQDIADTGICSESVVNVRNSGYVLMFINAENVGDDTDMIIINTEDEEVHCLNYDEDLYISTLKLTKIDNKKYKHTDNLLTFIYELKYISNNWTATQSYIFNDSEESITKFYPTNYLNLRCDNWNEEKLDALRKKYSEYNFIVKKP